MLEGRQEEELPERMLGCARLKRLQFDDAEKIDIMEKCLVGGSGGG